MRTLTLALIVILSLAGCVVENPRLDPRYMEFEVSTLLPYVLRSRGGRADRIVLLDEDYNVRIIETVLSGQDPAHRCVSLMRSMQLDKDRRVRALVAEVASRSTTEAWILKTSKLHKRSLDLKAKHERWLASLRITGVSKETWNRRRVETATTLPAQPIKLTDLIKEDDMDKLAPMVTSKLSGEVPTTRPTTLPATRPRPAMKPSQPLEIIDLTDDSGEFR